MTDEKCQLMNCNKCQELNTLDQLVEMTGTGRDVLKSWYVKYLKWEKVDTDGSERLRKVIINCHC